MAVSAWLVYVVSAVLTATVAVTFGEYAGTLLNSSIKAPIGAVAAGSILAITALRIWGARTIGRAPGPIVAVVVAMLAILAVVTHATASFVPAFVALLGLTILAVTARHVARPAPSSGGAVSVLMFAPIVISHVQIYRETGASLRRLAVALLTIVILFSVGVLDVLLNGLTATMTVIAIAGLAVILDVLRSRMTSQPSAPPVLAVLKGGLNEY